MKQIPLKVCVITQQIGKVISGPGVYARNLINHLLADGHQVWVIAPQPQRPPDPLQYTFIGVPQPWPAGNQARWLSLSLYFSLALSRLEKQVSLDVVHFVDAREALFCRSTAKRVGNINDTYSADLRPLAYYRHFYRDWLWRWSYYQAVHRLEPLAMQRLQVILANSQSTLSAIAAAYPHLVDKLRLCYKSIEMSQFLPALEARDQLPAHPPRILFVGSNMQRKGIANLIEAAPMVLEVLPAAEFWIVGQDTSLATWQEYAARLGVAEHFKFLGFRSQEDLVNLYAQADVFTMPSLSEALGIVFLEAMAAGTPVIGSRVGGIPEIITDQENGLLVPPADSKALASALRRMILDTSLQERFRQAGLETVRRFSVDNMMACTYAVYQPSCPCGRTLERIHK